MAFDSGVFLPTELWHLVSIYLQPEDLLSLGQVRLYLARRSAEILTSG